VPKSVYLIAHIATAVHVTYRDSSFIFACGHYLASAVSLAPQFLLSAFNEISFVTYIDIPTAMYLAKGLTVTLRRTLKVERSLIDLVAARTATVSATDEQLSLYRTIRFILDSFHRLVYIRQKLAIHPQYFLP
jgi:hypothetical protein